MVTKKKTKTPKKKTAKKALKGSTNPLDARMELYIPAEKKHLIDRVAAISKAEAVSRSTIILDALEMWLKRRRKKP
jgi:hypothetical protein